MRSFGVTLGIAALLFAASAMAVTVRIGLPAFPPSGADPFEATSRASLHSTRAVYDALTMLGADMAPEPALALSWRTTAPDTWVVTLRPNVAFSNGEPLTAEAVVVSYGFLKTPDAKTLIMAPEVANVASVRAIDELTVEFKTHEPEPSFARRLAVIPIVPPVYWRKVGHDGFIRAPIGSGSFVVENWESARITMRANEKSWRKPVADRLELLNLPIAPSRLQSLLSNRTDVIVDVGPDNVPILNASGFRVYQRPVSSVDVMALNVLSPGSPFKDVRVRRALNYAVDREAIAKLILHGLVPPATQVTARSNPEYDPSIAGYPYDPAKAKALLAEAGFPDGFSFVYEMNNAAGADMATITEQVAHGFAQIGVMMEIRPVPWPQMVRHIRQGGWDAKTYAFAHQFEALPAGDTLWGFRLHSCAWQKPWYCDEALTPMIADAKGAFDPAQRRALIHKILRRTHEQAAVVVLFEPVGLDGLSSLVENYSQLFGQISYDKLTVRGR